MLQEKLLGDTTTMTVEVVKAPLTTDVLANKWKQGVKPQIYIGEGVGAAVGGGAVMATTTIVIFPVIYYMINMYDLCSDKGLSNFAAFAYAFPVGIATGSTVGTAMGTTITGKLLKQEGSFKRSLLGSTVGAIVGSGLVLLAMKCPYTYPDDWLAHTITGLAILCPITGAVIGYNWGK